MKARLIHYWDDFRESFWFVPIVMSFFAGVAAVTMGEIDARSTATIDEHFSWLTSTPASARSALTSIASAMLTLVGVIFSITIVAVSMASSQYGSRLLRCFMTDSLAGYVMGTFIGTGLFCLIALRSVRDGIGSTSVFTPHLSTATAVAMGLFSIGLLIYFIHDVAISIQAPNIVEALAADLNAAIERLYPEALDESNEQPGEQAIESASAVSITTQQEGYVEGIDRDTLLEAAARIDGVIQILCSPGDFLVARDELAIAAVPQALDDEQMNSLAQRIESAFVVGARRTPRQDVVCSILELVDVAVRSLSPGINDPFTAMNCIDRLAAGLSKLARRATPDTCFYDSEEQLRLILVPVRCSSVIHAAFQQIRQFGASSVAVAIRLLEALSTIARNATRKEDFESLALETTALRSGFLDHNPHAVDRRDFDRHYQKLSALLEKHVSVEPMLES